MKARCLYKMKDYEAFDKTRVELEGLSPEKSEEVQKYHKFIIKGNYLHAKILCLTMEF